MKGGKWICNRYEYSSPHTWIDFKLFTATKTFGGCQLFHLRTMDLVCACWCLVYAASMLHLLFLWHILVIQWGEWNQTWYIFSYSYSPYTLNNKHLTDILNELLTNFILLCTTLITTLNYYKKIFILLYTFTPALHLLRITSELQVS